MIAFLVMSDFWQISSELTPDASGAPQRHEEHKKSFCDASRWLPTTMIMMMMMMHISLQTISYLHFSRFSAFTLNSRSPKEITWTTESDMQIRCFHQSAPLPRIELQKALFVVFVQLHSRLPKKKLSKEFFRKWNKHSRAASAGAKWKIKSEGFVFILHSSQLAKSEKKEKLLLRHSIAQFDAGSETGANQ